MNTLKNSSRITKEPSTPINTDVTKSSPRTNTSPDALATVISDENSSKQKEGNLEKKILRKIRHLFLYERVAWARSPEQRLQIRQEKEVPIIDELIQLTQEKLKDYRLLPKSKLKEALGYLCSLRPYLKNYTHYSEARLDNNVAERVIRPLALDRKNWIFVGSEEGGEIAAILFSLVQSCKASGGNPEKYLAEKS